MNKTSIADVAACIDLKRTPAGLEIKTARGLVGCVDAAYTVMRYFLQELGVSPNLARIVTGEQASILVLPDESLSEQDARILAIEDYLIYPISPILRGWGVIHPEWIEIPMDVYSQKQNRAEMTEGRVVPTYSIDLYRGEKDLTFPLFETILLGIQTCLSDRLNLEMRSLYGLYLEIEGRSTEVDSEKQVEMECLGRPAMYLLNRVLPVLSPNGNEVISEYYRNGCLITGESVQFEYDTLTSGWRVYYRSGKKWLLLNAPTSGESVAQQLITRRDFRTVYLRAAANIVERKLHEIQKKIYTYKLKSV